MLWKLDALQSFIRDLHWPEEVFAEHLDHRLKLMAADMIEAAAKRHGASKIISVLKIMIRLVKLYLYYMNIFYFIER